MYRAAIILLCLFIVPGALAQTTAPKKPDTRKSIGVISAIGHTFALQKVGVTVFGNELKEVPIDGWGIDGLVATKISALLSKQFNVRRVTFPKGAFAALETPGGLFRDSEAELQGIVRKIAAAQKCDLYVVVTRGGSAFGTTNQVVNGLGLVVAANPFFDNSHLYALSMLHLYDGQTFGLLRRQAASIGQPTFLKTIKGPHREVDQSWWPASAQAAQNEKLKAATRTLVEQSLAMTVPNLVGVK